MAIFIVFSVFILLRTFRLFDEVKQSQAIFVEYTVSLKAIDRAITLLPFSLVVYIGGAFLLGGLIASILALAFFIPAIRLSRKQMAVFELAGTDRVNPAKATLAKVFTTALIGILYFAFLIIYSLFEIGLEWNKPVF